MNILRWLLAIVIVLAGVGFGAFVLLANNFRRSFGASENNLLIAVTAPLGELFAAYRADRYREYGQPRDQMPDKPAQPPKAP